MGFCRKCGKNGMFLKLTPGGNCRPCQDAIDHAVVEQRQLTQAQARAADDLKSAWPAAVESREKVRTHLLGAAVNAVTSATPNQGARALGEFREQALRVFVSARVGRGEHASTGAKPLPGAWTALGEALCLLDAGVARVAAAVAQYRTACDRCKIDPDPTLVNEAGLSELQMNGSVADDARLQIEDCLIGAACKVATDTAQRLQVIVSGCQGGGSRAVSAGLQVHGAPSVSDALKQALDRNVEAAASLVCLLQEDAALSGSAPVQAAVRDLRAQLAKAEEAKRDPRGLAFNRALATLDVVSSDTLERAGKMEVKRAERAIAGEPLPRPSEEVSARGEFETTAEYEARLSEHKERIDKLHREMLAQRKMMLEHLDQEIKQLLLDVKAQAAVDARQESRWHSVEAADIVWGRYDADHGICGLSIKNTDLFGTTWFPLAVELVRDDAINVVPAMRKNGVEVNVFIGVSIDYRLSDRHCSQQRAHLDSPEWSEFCEKWQKLEWTEFQSRQYGRLERQTSARRPQHRTDAQIVTTREDRCRDLARAMFQIDLQIGDINVSVPSLGRTMPGRIPNYLMFDALGLAAPVERIGHNTKRRAVTPRVIAIAPHLYL